MSKDVEAASPPPFNPTYATEGYARSAGPVPTEAPPSYDSIYGRVKGARERSNGNPLKFMGHVVDIFCGTLGGLIWLGFVLALPILLMIIGGVYWNDCRAQSWIPIWLVILGVVSSLETIATFFIRMRKLLHDGHFFGQLTEQERQQAQFCDGPITIFTFVWFIIGCYWVFTAFDDVQYYDPTSSEFCHITLYRFAFWVAVLGLFGFGIMFLFMCCCCCCFCCMK